LIVFERLIKYANDEILTYTLYLDQH